MGWKSTIDMTRAEMEQAVRDEVEPDFSGISDDDLASILEVLRGGDEHGHNYRVVPCTTTRS